MKRWTPKLAEGQERNWDFEINLVQTEPVTFMCAVCTERPYPPPWHTKVFCCLEAKAVYEAVGGILNDAVLSYEWDGKAIRLG